MKEPQYIICWRNAQGKEDKDSNTKFSLKAAEERVEFLNELYVSWNFKFWYEPVKG